MIIETAEGFEFDKLALRLGETAVMDSMTKAVLRVFRLSFGQRGTGRISEANLNIPVFLAVYVIPFHPTFVFESKNSALEKDIKAVSKQLLESFHFICEELYKKPVQKVVRDLTEDFPTKLHVYVSKFKAWKILDNIKLAERIKHDLAATIKRICSYLWTILQRRHMRCRASSQSIFRRGST